MKRNNFLKIMMAAAICLAAGYVVYSAQTKTGDFSDVMLYNLEAIAQGEINEDCPNGCVDGRKGCYCYGWHEDSKEYKW